MYFEDKDSSPRLHYQFLEKIVFLQNGGLGLAEMAIFSTNIDEED